MRIDLTGPKLDLQNNSPAFIPYYKDKSRYQVLYGGAGCVHPHTKIHTEHGLIRICDIDRPMRVLSWNEKSQRFQLSLSGGSFPKGKASLYRISTQHGVFESSGHHLVLLSSGEYRRADNLQIGDELSLAQPLHRETIEGICLSESLLDEQRYSQTDADFLGDYAELCRQYDPLPHERGDYALFSEPSKGDALGCARSYSPSRETQQGKLQKHSRPCLYDDRTCKTHCVHSEPYSGLYEEDCTSASFFECISGSHQESQQSQKMCESHHKAASCEESELVRGVVLVDSCLPPKANKSPILSRASFVESIEVVDESEYWCMQVLNTNNYVCESGFIHHNSGKSHKVARRILIRCLTEKHNYLIARKVNRTLRRSVFTLFKNTLSLWCQNWGLRLSDVADINLTELTIVIKSNGSQLMFTGMDDPEKLKSIEGVTSIWLEEATEFTQEDFEQLDLRLRGDHGVDKQIAITFNPISEQHWLKKVFFDDPIDDVFTLKTTFLDNKFIDEEYKMVMENKKKTNPRYYGIYALGNWGTAEGLVFNRVKMQAIKLEDVSHLECVQGLDFGYTNDPTAFNQSYIDQENKIIYVYDGFYQKGMSNESIASKMKAMRVHRHKTVADSSEPKSIDAISARGCRITGAAKGKDSINAGIDFLLEYEIIVNNHLVEFMTEFNNYAWSIDKDGKAKNKPVDDFNHFIDSLRYATEHLQAKRKMTRPMIRG